MFTRDDLKEPQKCVLYTRKNRFKSGLNKLTPSPLEWIVGLGIVKLEPAMNASDHPSEKNKSFGCSTAIVTGHKAIFMPTFYLSLLFFCFLCRFLVV